MPLILFLAAPGSPCRLLRPSARLAGQWRPASSTLKFAKLHHVVHTRSPPCTAAVPCRGLRTTALRARNDTLFSSPDGISRLARQYSAQAQDHGPIAEDEDDIYRFFPEEEESVVEERETSTYAQTADNDIFGSFSQGESMVREDVTPSLTSYTPFKAQISRASRKAQRPSQPTLVLNAIQTSVRDLYLFTPHDKTDLSYSSPRRIMPGGHRRQDPGSSTSLEVAQEHKHPVSLYSVLARYIGHLTASSSTDGPFICTQQEHELLQAEGLTQEMVQTWAVSLVKANSTSAARIFQRDAKVPPLFLVLLFLRRKHIRVYALGIIMNHINLRLQTEPISWITLKIIAIRLLRHARKVWPESIPWIASMFTTKAASIHEGRGGTTNLSPRTLGDFTHFSNTLLSLISLPSAIRPMLSSRHQENAQFQVLQYMASHEPSIAVTRTGFRAIARIQLTHAKTEQEKDWAELKGPSWPPWKEDRTAMDEGKGYEYGASRASKILHRMFEAGYAARSWEEVAEVYAGWDTDLSPTIQTRTLLPPGSRGDRVHRLWAARIRTTRTRREAWACFLAHETSGAPAHEDIYLAMFEKMHHMEAQRRFDSESHQLGVEETQEQPTALLLPGDMKEVLPDQSSPLHYVYLSEPMPTYEQLYRRMTSKNVQPTKRLLAFLLETHPDFATTFKMLEKAKDGFDGGIGCLISGNHGAASTVHKVPGYFLVAFVRFLCRFGHPTKALSARSTFLAQDQHARQFMFNEDYLLEYAYALLLHYKPRYQPAWTAFMEKIIFSRFGSKSLYHEKDSAMGLTGVQYKIVDKLLNTLASIDVDVEGDLFNLACTATRYAAQAAHRGVFPIGQGHDLLTTGSYRLRTLFHHLVGTPVDPGLPVDASGVPPHVPGPAELHAYVRALGVLRDYEGLYSFSTWLTKNNVEVVARARAQHGGSDMLFRTIVALRAATGGWLEEGLDSRPKAPEEIAQLIKTQIDSVEEWGGWPSKKYVTLYIEGHVRSVTPVVGGR